MIIEAVAKPLLVGCDIDRRLFCLLKPTAILLVVAGKRLLSNYRWGLEDNARSLRKFNENLFK